MLECLKKGLRVASQCMDPSVQCQLMVELLNSYFYFYAQGNQEVSGCHGPAVVAGGFFVQWSVTHYQIARGA